MFFIVGLSDTLNITHFKAVVKGKIKKSIFFFALDKVLFIWYILSKGGQTNEHYQ